MPDLLEDHGAAADEKVYGVGYRLLKKDGYVDGEGISGALPTKRQLDALLFRTHFALGERFECE